MMKREGTWKSGRWPLLGLLIVVPLGLSFGNSWAGWVKEEVGSGGLDMRGVAVGDGRNDGKARVYGVNADHYVYEFSYEGGAWVSDNIFEGPDVMTAIAVGNGRDDQPPSMRVYTGCRDGHVYESEYEAGSWTTREIGHLPVCVNDMVIGPGRDDGHMRVYATVYELWWGRRIYEFTFVKAVAMWVVDEIWQNGGYGIALGDGRGDGKTRIYFTGAYDAHELWYVEDHWECHFLGLQTPLDGFLDVAVGEGRHDGTPRVYVTECRPLVWELTWVGSWPWGQHKIPVGRGPGIAGVTVGDGRNDGVPRVYAVDMGDDGHAHELDYLETRYYRNYLGRGKSFDPGLGPGYMLDVATGNGRGEFPPVMRVYAADTLGYVYEFTYVDAPLVSTSDLATAYTSSRNLDRITGTDDLSIVYQSDSRAYAGYSPDGGKNWESFYMGRGETPTVGVADPWGPLPLRAVSVWVGPFEQVQTIWGRHICASALYVGEEPDDYPVWTVGTGVQFVPEPGTPYLPALVVGRVNKAHVAWETDFGPLQSRHLYYLSLPYSPWPPAQVTPELVDEAAGGGTWRMSPSIDLDYIVTYPERPHILYRKEEGGMSFIRYAVRNGTWDVWPDPISKVDEYSSFPFLEIYGEDMHALWHAHKATNPSEPDEIWYRTKKVYEPWWPPSWSNISTSSLWESQFPVMAANYASWSEEFTSPNWEIMMREKPFTGPIYNISNTDATSMYSHINYWQRDTDPEFLYFAWTEGDGSGSPYEVRVLEYPLNHPPVAYLYVGTGQTEPSFYCVERDSFVQFGSEACRQVDIDTDQLIYRLPGLMPWMRYQLVVTGYWDGEDEIRERLDIDGLDQRLIKLEPGVPETLTVSIPPAAYEDDEEANVSLTLISGEWAVSGPMTLYEFEREEGEGGGSQVAGTSDPELRSFNLSQSYPNPFSSASTIEYVVPGPSQTTLKIYDATGRLVRSLVDEEQKRGTYRVSWDGKAENGAPVAGGVYFYRLTAGDFFSSKKVVVLR